MFVMDTVFGSIPVDYDKGVLKFGSSEFFDSMIIDSNTGVISVGCSGDVDARTLRRTLRDAASEMEAIVKDETFGSACLALANNYWGVVGQYEVDFVSSFDLSGDASELFAGFKNVSGLDNVGVSNVTTMSYMFEGCSSDSFNPDVSGWDTSNVKGMNGMFSGCSGESFNPDISDWNVSRVTDMNTMFKGCSGDNFNPDVSKWDTSNVVHMEHMFENCDGESFSPNLTCLDVSSIYVGLLRNGFKDMFKGCLNSEYSVEIFEDKAILFDSSFNDLFETMNARKPVELLTNNDQIIEVNVDMDSYDNGAFDVSWEDSSGYKAGHKVMSLYEIKERADGAALKLETSMKKLDELKQLSGENVDDAKDVSLVDSGLVIDTVEHSDSQFE